MSKELTRTVKGSYLTDLILEVFPVHGRILAAGDRLSSEVGLTSALWQVLGALEDNPRSASQISRVMGLTRQSVQRSINIMESDGLVQFLLNPDHKTSPLVQMTSKGQEAFRRVMRLQIQWVNELSEDLKAEELEIAVRVLRSLLESLESNE